MKKFKPFLIIATAICYMVAVFAGCSNTTKGGSAKGSTDIHMSDPAFGFISAEIYDSASEEKSFTKDMLSKRTVLNADTEYCLFINFTLTSARNNDGQSLLKVIFTFDALNVMNGTIEDVSTGYIEDMTFQDAQTGNIGKTTTLSFKVPPLSAEPKYIEMIVRLKPVTVGESHIMFGYEYDAGGAYKVLGTDGKTTNLKIQKVKIDTPVLEYDDTLGVISWTHVKNADYYCFYETGYSAPILGFLSDEPYYFDASNNSVGSPLAISIEYLDLSRGTHLISVKAFTNNTANVDNSDNSGHVTVRV